MPRLVTHECTAHRQGVGSIGAHVLQLLAQLLLGPHPCIWTDADAAKSQSRAGKWSCSHTPA